MTLTCLVIGSYLAGRVGDGKKVRFGAYDIMGCVNEAFHPGHMI